MSTGATWGLSGPVFLIVYPALLVVAAAAVRPLRTLIGPRRPDGRLALRPVEVGLVRGGDRLAVAAALARLRAADLIDEGGSPVRTRPPGQVGDAFDRVLLDQLADRRATRQVDRMVSWPAVRDALADVRAGLVIRDWLRSRRQHRAARLLALLPFAVFVLGVVRAGVGAARGRPIGYLAVEILVALVVALVVQFGAGMPPTRAARRELARLRADVGHLDPGLRPSWNTYGPAAAGLSVALWGIGALAAAEPVFAAGLAPAGRVGIGAGSGSATGWSGAGGGGGWFSGGGGSSCSSGGSCGGGSSCGGGGGCGG